MMLWNNKKIIKKPSFNKETRPNEEYLQKFERKSQNDNTPMSNWSRVIIETDEDVPKTLAIITNDNYEQVEGIRIRFKPVYPD